jgi:acetyltransferase
MHEVRSLDGFFRPRAVAIVGASPERLTIGHRILENLLAYGFTGPVYPVHPKATAVRGLPAFHSIEEISGPVDLVHVVVRNTLVLEQLEACARKGVKAVVVNTSGFREVGGEGVELERRLAARARELGIRLFGPNCQGVMNTEAAFSLYANFTFARIRPGAVSIVAQGGGVAEVLNNDLQERGVGLRMYASNGNACDVSVPEILDYFGADDGCRVILLHMESVPDPRALLEVARRVSRVKPILALKAGVTATPELKKQLSDHVVREIGALARPDDIRFTDALPKTRSGKIMRRLLKEIATTGVAKGDTTTLEDLNVLSNLSATLGDDE